MQSEFDLEGQGAELTKGVRVDDNFINVDLVDLKSDIHIVGVESSGEVRIDHSEVNCHLCSSVSLLDPVFGSQSEEPRHVVISRANIEVSA